MSIKQAYKKQGEQEHCDIKGERIADCLEINPNAPEILMEAGMHCFGCALAHNETVAQAVAVHGEDLETLLSKLNEGLED